MFLLGNHYLGRKEMEVVQNKFAFFANFAETISQLPSEKRADAYKAICEYGIYGILPDDILLKSICLIAQNSIFKNEGGAPKGNKNAKKDKNDENEKQLKQPQNNPKTTSKQPTFQETETETEVETENNTISEDMVVKNKNFDLTAINEILKKYNLATIRDLTDERKTKLRQRCESVGGFENFLEKLEVALAQSSFLRGNNKNGWKADFDFFLQKSSWQKLIEGSYADSNKGLIKTHTIGEWL